MIKSIKKIIFKDYISSLRNNYIKLYAFNKIQEHLDYNLHNEKRKRELLRTKVAIKTIDVWLKMGEKDYDSK